MVQFEFCSAGVPTRDGYAAEDSRATTPDRAKPPPGLNLTHYHAGASLDSARGGADNPMVVANIIVDEPSMPRRPAESGLTPCEGGDHARGSRSNRL